MIKRIVILMIAFCVKSVAAQGDFSFDIKHIYNTQSGELELKMSGGYSGHFAGVIKIEDSKAKTKIEPIYAFTTFRPNIIAMSISYDNTFTRKGGEVKTSGLFFPGRLDIKCDRDFIYTLPIKDANSTVVTVEDYQIGSALEDVEGRVPHIWKVMKMSMNQGDQILASRKGVVVAVDDKSGINGLDENKFNAIWVIHDDGSVIKYGPIKRSSQLVKIGSMVYPGTPLATVETIEGKSELWFSIYFLVENPTVSRQGIKSMNHMLLLNYFYPKFMTDSGVITPESGVEYKAKTTAEVVNKEMSKSEIRKFGK